MSAAAIARPAAPPVDAIAAAVLWLAVFSGGFVFFEPSPYEAILAAAIPAWLFAGLRVPRAIAPLLLLMIVFVAGGVLTMTQSQELLPNKQPVFYAVTAFLALTACFYAALVAAEPRWAERIATAYIAAAVATTALGTVGYFRLVPGEMFTLYGRAAGGFKDPNVFGPFLVFPYVVLVQRALTRPLRQLPRNGALALFLLFGIFLSFSRAAWGLTLLATAGMALLLFLNEHRARIRARYIGLSALGGLAAAALLLAALSIEPVGALFAERAQFVQEYDAGRLGRFARHAIGFSMMMEHPLGLGYAEFGKLFGEDEHDIWLKALTAYGWLGFVAFFTIVAWTLIAAVPLLFRSGPLQHLVQAAYAVFLGHVLIATVIDIDHWRHVYLLIGLIWGTLAYDRRRHLARLAQVARRALPRGYREVALTGRTGIEPGRPPHYSPRRSERSAAW